MRTVKVLLNSVIVAMMQLFGLSADTALYIVQLNMSHRTYSQSGYEVDQC